MDSINKNIYLNQDISIKEKNTYRLKIFDYFYTIIDRKSQTSVITLYFLHFFETIQLISFAFSFPHYYSWKISKEAIITISKIISGFRLTPLLMFVPFRFYSIIFFLWFFLIFIFSISLYIQISYRKSNSKWNNRLLIWVHISIAPLTILLFIPITELFLIPINCDYNIIFTNSIKCWSNTHLFFVVLGIISALCFCILILFINLYYFYPFQYTPSTVKLTSSIDTILILLKVIYILKFLLINNEYISIAILLISSILLVYKEFKEKNYNINKLELFLNTRNILMLWTFFMLLISKLCLESKVNHLIYLLLFGYPIIIFSCIMFLKENQTKINFNNSSFNNINSCLLKVKFLIRLINSFFEDNKNNLKFNENGNQKDDILLKGFVKIHTETCLKEDCPLTKFIKSNGNLKAQKQSLLNYMSNFFNSSIKKFPNNVMLRLYYIQFNYDKRYNLNGVRQTLEEIKKMKYGIKEEYIIYCMEQTVTKLRIKDSNDGSEVEKESFIINQYYKRLKELISSSTKLYVEFWGIFATNITNNINTSKLNKLGEKLNLYLKEITYLWENNLKNKKINSENENIVQLYSMFLREILWDINKSEIIKKKINEEHKIQIYNKMIEDKPKLDALENISETQDFTIFINSNEKGKCKIVQSSSSLSYLIGYQKNELLNKPMEFLMPSIFIDGFGKNLEEYIKNYNSQKNMDQEFYNGGDKKINVLLIKSKIGYLIPFNFEYSIYDDNDFSNSYFIKLKLETIDSKSTYAYYILTKPDFSIEGISSSSIHLGLTIDLLKKYIIKINLLIRTSQDNTLNLFQKYKEYIENMKKVVWVYPDIIYPKNENLNNKDTPIQDLIKASKKKKYNLQIFEMVNENQEIVGFLFKFIEISQKKKDKKEIVADDYIPPFKNEIIFDMLNLNYIRTVTVQKKSGLRNLRDKENNIDNIEDIKSKSKKKKRKHSIDEESSEDEKDKIILTKDKILELQTKDVNGIKSFISILPFYGEDISLVRHRPNKEQYPCGKAQEPLVKISASEFKKRIDARLKKNPTLYNKFKNRDKNKERENNSVKLNYATPVEKEEENINKEVEEINRDIIGNNSVSLMNIFNIRSIKLSKFIDFCVYAFIIILTTTEFVLTFMFFLDNIKRFSFLSSSYKLLNDIVYIKYFITEAISANYVKNYVLTCGKNESNYISMIKNELSSYRQDISKIINEFNSGQIRFPKEYSNFITSTKVTIKTISNGIYKTEIQPYSSAINKLITSIFYISTISNEEKIDMNNTYSYELMVNLLDGYYIPIQGLIKILFEDFKSKTRNSGIKNIVIFSVSLFISCIYLIIFWKLMTRLDNDREKPINLFLTIKKNIFEELKNSSENFSNKLLNKIFGVEENEEESKEEYRTYIKASDINIAKFKALNEFKVSNNSGNFIYYFIQLSIFYFVYNILIMYKYINTRIYYSNIDGFLKVYDIVQFCQIYFVTRIDITKQYLYNKSILNYNYTEDQMIYNYLQCFLNISDQLEIAIKETSKTKSFLEGSFKSNFRLYFYSNYTELIKNDSKDRYSLYNYINSEEGFSTITYKIFDIIRFLSVKYFMDDKRDINNGNISQLINDKMWIQLDSLLLYIVRPWYRNINNLLDSSYYSYVVAKLIEYIVSFIVVIIIISLYYWIVWKRYEFEFIDSIKKSFDLINLIPEEIKTIIVSKLNEQN